jgi:hypothetical protein
MSSITENNFSYEYANKIRSVDQAFQQMIQSSPTFLSLINPNGMTPINTKHEWLEDEVTPFSSAITSFDTDGDGTGVNVASTAGLIAGSIIGVRKATGASVTEIMKVASVDSATDLTVVRDYGGSTGVLLAVTDILFLISSPKNSGTNASPTAGQEPDTNYNYTEIFDDTVKMPRTTQLVDMYGMENALNYQLGVRMQQLAYRMNNSVIYGRRVERSASENGTMGGVLQFLEGGIVDTTGGAISSTIINNVLEDVYIAGGYAPRLAMLMNTNQARKVSAFLKAANEPIIYKNDSGFQTAGYAVNKFQGDLPTVNGSFITDVVVDPNFPKDQIAILNMNKIEMNYLSPMIDMDATLPGFDGVQRRVLTETTMTVKDGTTAHGLITGLDL